MRLPVPQARRLKARAAENGETIQDVLERAALQYLAAHESGQALELSDALRGEARP